MVWLDTGTPHYCQLRYDGWKNGHLGTDMLTWRGISNSLHGKGTCDLFIGQLDLREHLFAQYVPFLASISICQVWLWLHWLMMNWVSFQSFNSEWQLSQKPHQQLFRKWGWKSELVKEMREVCNDHASFRVCLNLNQSFLIGNMFYMELNWFQN